MSAHLLALRERARRWWGRQRVSLGLDCVHVLDPKAWRPGVRYKADHPDARQAIRCCGYCDQIDEITDAEYYAQFNRVFFRRRPA